MLGSRIRGLPAKHSGVTGVTVHRGRNQVQALRMKTDSRVGRVRTVVNARDDILTTRTSTQVLSIPILLCNYAGASSFHYYADRIMIPTW